MNHRIAALLTVPLLIAGLAAEGGSAHAVGERQFREAHANLEQQTVTKYGIHGYAGAAQGDSAILGWNEAYVLDSYFALYENAQDTAYLDKMISSIDYSLSYLSDHDQDGYAGWQTARYAERKFPQNGNFEEPIAYAEAGLDVPLPLAGFVASSGSDPAKITIGGPDADVVLESSASTQKLTYSLTDYVPDVEYVMSFRYRSDGAGAGARLFMYDWGASPAGVMKDMGNVNMDVHTSGATWQEVEFRFKTPSYVNRIGFVLQHQHPTAYPGSKAYFDDFKLIRIGRDVPVDPSSLVPSSGSDPAKMTIGGPDADVVLESSASTQKLTFSLTGYSPDTEYIMSFRFKTDGSGAGARLFMYDWGATPAGVMKDANGVNMDKRTQSISWEEVEFRFTTPSYVDKIGFVLQHVYPTTYPGGKAYFDDFKLTAFPTGSGAEPTAWAFLPTADEQHVYTSAANGYGSSGKGLAVTADGTHVQGVQAYIKDFTANAEHSLSFVAKTGAVGSGRIALIDQMTGLPVEDIDGQPLEIVLSGVADWTAFEYRFQTPADDRSLILRVFSDPADTGVLSVDNVAIAQTFEYLVHEAGMYGPVARLIEEIRQDSALAAAVWSGTTTYGDKADEYVPYVTDFVEKWEPLWTELSSTEGVYVNSHDDATGYPGNTQPHNQYLRMVPVLLSLHAITSNTDYLDKAHKMLTFFKNKLRLIDSSYYAWNYYDPALTGELSQIIKAEDTSHGNLDIQAALAGYRHGVVFTATDMQRLANTYSALIWNGSFTSPVVYRFLETNPARTSYYFIPSTYLDLRDWLLLTPWNADIYDSAAVMYAATSGSGVASQMAAYAYLDRFDPGDGN